MKFVQLLIVLIFAAVIFAAVGFFGYELFLKPAKLDRQEAIELADAPPPTPPPDYSLPAFEKAAELVKADPMEARTALLNFIIQYPQSTKLAEARQILGDINTNLVFTTVEAPGKLDYAVQRGDSLVKIASKTNSNAELIMRSNNLLTIDLQIGQQLRIPQLDPSILIDRTANTLTLYNGGEFFKEYSLLSFQAPSIRAAAETKIKEKLALKGDDRIAFGSRDYVGSERWLMLDGGVVIRGLLPPGEEGAPPSMPPGIVVSQEDIDEIFPLVSRGTPVTIQ